MLWTSAEQDRVIAAIRAGAQRWTAKELDAILDAGAKRKPVGYDNHSRAVQQRYSGNQRQIVAQVLQQRYPLSYKAMPVSPVNWMALFAASDSGCYTVEPGRWLSAADGERLPKEDERAQTFAKAVDAADLASVMPEAERRALAVHNVIFRVGFDAEPGAPEGEGRACVQLYWPHDVVMLAHASRPTDSRYAFVWALRQASPDAVSAEQWWEVFSRDFIEGEDGSVSSWGAWYRVLVSTGGEQRGATAMPVLYPGERCPVMALSIGMPEGSWLVDQDRDVVAIVDELNASRSNEQYVMDMQGHTQMVYAGTKDEGVTAVGADQVVTILPGDTLTTVDYNPKFADMREGRKLSMREVAVSRRNSPDAYATEPGPPLSGVSRKIANAPHDQRVEELRHAFVDFEEGQLLPAIIDVIDTFSNKTIGSDVDAHMTPRKQSDFEEPEAKQRRAQEALDAGWISPARAAVEAGWYASVDEAVKSGLADELKAKAPSPPPFGQPFGQQGQAPPSPFAARLQAMRSGQPEKPEAEEAPTE